MHLHSSSKFLQFPSHSFTTIYFHLGNLWQESITILGHVDRLLCWLKGVRRGVSTEAIMSSHQPQGPGNGPPSAGMSMQHPQGAQQPPPPAQSMSQQNLNQIVRLYSLELAVLSCVVIFGIRAIFEKERKMKLNGKD
jgi:hypothetical protein